MKSVWIQSKSEKVKYNQKLEMNHNFLGPQFRLATAGVELNIMGDFNLCFDQKAITIKTFYL